MERGIKKRKEKVQIEIKEVKEGKSPGHMRTHNLRPNNSKHKYTIRQCALWRLGLGPH